MTVESNATEVLDFLRTYEKTKDYMQGLLV